MTMKILAFTDNHGDLNSLKKVEKKVKTGKPNIAICCGDISMFGKDLDKLIKKIDSFKIPVLIVPGNHEDRNALLELCEKSKNVVYLHGGIFNLKNYYFIGYEVNGFSKTDSDFRKFGKKIEKEVLKNLDKNDKFILITHAPPYKTNIDLLQLDHVGNKDLRKFIERNQPVLALSGHIHEDFYKKDKIAETTIANPGPEGMFFNV